MDNKEAVFLVGLWLEYPDICNLSLTDKLNNRVLCDSDFWMVKLRNDFSFMETIDKKMAKSYYIFLYRTMNKPYHNRLMLACKEGYLPIVKNIIENDTSISDITKSISTLKTGDVSYHLLFRDVYTDSSINSGLIEAFKYDHFDIARYLMERGADIHCNNDECLSYEGYFNDIEMVKYLAEKDIDIEYDEILYKACYDGDLPMVKFLMENGMNENKEEALNISIIRGHYDITRYLIDAGAITGFKSFFVCYFLYFVAHLLSTIMNLF